MQSNVIFARISGAATYAILSAIVIVALLIGTFFIAEPRISYGDEDVDFTIRQTITDETSFLVPPSNVTMVGPINGITGGNATGTTQFTVRTNNPTGYRVDISFEDQNLDGIIMQGDTTGGGEIRNYSGMINPTTPSFNFVASTSAQFAFASYSSTTSDTAQRFRNNSSDCNIPGGSVTFGTCFNTVGTATTTIASRASAAPTGATSTLLFRINVPSGAVPAPTSQVYTATATLSVIAL